jgi:hypothetical protein
VCGLGRRATTPCRSGPRPPSAGPPSPCCRADMSPCSSPFPIAGPGEVSSAARVPREQQWRCGGRIGPGSQTLSKPVGEVGDCAPAAGISTAPAMGRSEPSMGSSGAGIAHAMEVWAVGARWGAGYGVLACWPWPSSLAASGGSPSLDFGAYIGVVGWMLERGPEERERGRCGGNGVPIVQ